MKGSLLFPSLLKITVIMVERKYVVTLILGLFVPYFPFSFFPIILVEFYLFNTKIWTGHIFVLSKAP